MGYIKSPFLKRLWAYRRAAAGAAVYWSGAARAYEAAARPTGAIILMFHSVASDDAADFIDPPNRLPPAMFERQMAFLSERRRVLPLSQLVRQIESGIAPPAGTVCITLDDGYRDNLTTVAPILEKYRLPATIFLATGYVERGEAQWSDTLFWMLKHRTSDSLSIPYSDLEHVNLAAPSKQQAARRALHSLLLESAHADRAQILIELKKQLSPSGRPPRLTMNWDEARELRHRYPLVEIGGHTRDHIDLRRHRGVSARSQIVGCAEDLRRELDIEIGHFSFPYSRWCAETREIVIGSGWKSAVGMGDSPRISPASDRYAMPRVEAPRTMTELRFKTSGAYPGALAMLGLN